MTNPAKLRPGQWVRHRPNSTKGYEYGKVLSVGEDGLAAIRFYRAIRWFFSDIDEFVPHEWTDDDITTDFERRRFWYFMHPEACHGREVCPCCGYPTLLPVRDETVGEFPLFKKSDGTPAEPTPLKVAMDTANCPVCLWFDRGGDDDSVDRHDVMNDMTLREARENFGSTGTMYPPGETKTFARALRGRTVAKLRSDAISCFDRLRDSATTGDRKARWIEIEALLAEQAAARETERDRLEAAERAEKPPATRNRGNAKKSRRRKT